ncbi:hypothetical protein M3Y97_01021700 [Aphelenchoides bicaudatus]|nr:hypothetical protein M3Y97_01021700 [Aphelenchoides bicaudatus]
MDQGNVNQPRMTTDQMKALSEKLSTEDKMRVGEILRSCSTEVLLKRGVPIAVLIVTGLHLARHKLPQSLRIGPRRWIFNAFLATGCLTLSNILFSNPCFERLQPLMNELNQKYNDPNYAGSAYDRIRDANRHRQGSQQAGYGAQSGPVYNQVVSSMGSNQEDIQSNRNTENYLREQPSPLQDQYGSKFDDSRSYLISGTPLDYGSKTSDNSMRLSNNPPKEGTTYGDVDFS